jgi:hypothetical protein
MTGDEEKGAVIYEIPYTLQLKHPFERGKQEKVTEITFQRRLKGKDFKGIVAGHIRFDDMLSLISRGTAEPISTIEELDVEDFLAAADVVNYFLGAGQTTGGNV